MNVSPSDIAEEQKFTGQSATIEARLDRVEAALGLLCDGLHDDAALALGPPPLGQTPLGYNDQVREYLPRD